MERVGDGPAAVFGDETCIKPLPFDELRVGRRKDKEDPKVRKPAWIIFTERSSRIRL